MGAVGARFLLSLALPLLLGAVYRELRAAFLRAERREWQAFMGQVELSPRARGAPTRGVVLIGGTAHSNHGVAIDYTVDALLAIAALRRSGCRLPVELWHDHDDAFLNAFLNTTVRAFLNASGAIILRSLLDNSSGPARRFAYGLKPYVMMHSEFDEFLFLDADNVPLVDPTPLFATPEYELTGAVFWADFKSLRMNHIIWPVLGREPMPTQLLDSGQVLIDRVRHQRVLALAAFFQQRYAKEYVHPPFYFIGDKDMFLLASLALSVPCHIVAPCGLLGFTAGDTLCGHSFLHGHPGRPSQPLFMHRVSAKWSSTRDYPHLRALALKRGRLTTDYPGTTSLKLRPEGCGPCPHHGPVGDEHGCFDLDTELDGSAAAREALAQAWRLEEELLWLREAIAGPAGLREGWWRSWGQYVQRSP